MAAALRAACGSHLHMLSQLRGYGLIKALDMTFYANDMDNNLSWRAAVPPHIMAPCTGHVRLGWHPQCIQVPKQSD